MTGFLNYSSAAVPTTLAAPLSSVTPGSTGSVQVASVSGMPTRFPFTLILEWNTPNAEVVTVTQAATGAGPFTFANCVRGDDGTSAPSHNSGVSVTHGVSARDFYKGASDWINVTAADYGADPTGVADSTAAIQAAFNAVPAGGATVYFPAGLYKTTAPLIVPTSYANVRGPGYGFAATIFSAASTPQTAMLILNNTGGVVQQVSVRDLALKGNANSGHGLVSRVENGYLANVIVQNVSGDAFHFSWDGLATTYIDSMVMTNCYASTPGARGLYVDKYLTSSEFFACHFAGGASPTPGGTYGMHIQGANLKFVACHPFLFASGGLFLDGTTTGAQYIQVIGGEYETNGGPHIKIANGAIACRISGVNTYVSAGTSPAQDIIVTGSTYVTIESCQLDGAATNAALELNNVQQATIRGNLISPSPYTTGSPPHGIQNDAASGSSYLAISDNIIKGQGTFNTAISLGGATHCSVTNNKILTADNIGEGAGGDYNVFTGNDVVPWGGITGAVSTVGTHTRAALNPGYNPVGKITSPPAVAASTTPVTNSTGVDCMVIVTLAAAATATSISVGGNATGITSSVASAVLPPVKVPAGQTITLTYTNAPTWVWFGD